MPINRIIAYLELSRAWNCAITFLGVIVGAVIVGASPLEAPVIIAGIAAALIAGGGNVINDYFDYETDIINRPDRPIPSGRTNRYTAVILSCGLFAIGLILTLLLNVLCIIVAVLNSIMLLLYGRYSKSLLFLSNLSISYLVGSVFLFGGLTIGYIEATTVLLFLCAFFMTLSREIIKDVADVEGDSSIGGVTLPLRFGAPISRVVAAAAALTAILLSPLPFLWGIMGTYYLIIVVLADIIFAVSMVLSADRSRRLMTLGMVLALAAFIVGAIA